MSEQLANQFAIEAATEADVAGISQAHFQSMLETYSNEAAGIDVAWIRQNLASYVGPESEENRLETVRQAETDPEHTLYLVVKGADGHITGFFHATRDDDEQQARIEAIYLTEESRGTGVADQLMERGLEFAGNLPVRLETLDYNQRAISFYEKYGFEKVPDSEAIQKAKLPVFAMERPAPTEASHEV